MKKVLRSAGIICLAALFTTASFSQKNKDAGLYNTLQSTPGKITIGLGMIVDTPSNISCQYNLYNFLISNPITIDGKDAIEPVITTKRGSTSFYLEGIYSSSAIDLKLWQKGVIVKRIQYKPQDIVNENPGESDASNFYKELYTAVTGAEPKGKLKISGYDNLESLDKMVDGKSANIQTFLLGSAINYVPAISFRKDLYNIYTNGKLETEYNELKEFKGKKFKYKSFEEYVEAIYPAISALYQTPKFMETNPLEAAASVLQLYKIKQADNFFFTSKFVDDRAKIAARKVAFPTWKRPGTAITYYQAAMDFGTAGYDDAALESYYSALIMTEGLNAYPLLVYSLREHIYDGLAQLQTKLGNPGSALLFTQMSELYKEFFNSSTLKDRNKAFEKMSNEVTSYFGKIEETAMNARQKKRSALFNAIGGIAMASASAVNDGANGLTELSSQTQQLTTAAADNANVVGDFKTNSLAASREAAQAFNDIYGDVVKQLQANKSEVGTERPVITTDFIKRLGDKELSAEKKDAFIAFAGKITLVQDDVKKYYEAATDDERSSLLKGIFKKLATAEMSIFIKESMGENPGKQFLTVAN